jgi:hypothetical protein
MEPTIAVLLPVKATFFPETSLKYLSILSAPVKIFFGSEEQEEIKKQQKHNIQKMRNLFFI